MRDMNEGIIKEGRAYIINGLLAYGEGFGVLAREEITQELMEDLDEGLETIEAAIPVFISLWEMSNKLKDKDEQQTFLEFLAEVLEDKQGKHGLFG